MLKKLLKYLCFWETNKYNLFDSFVHSSFWLTVILCVHRFVLLEMPPKKVMKSSLKKLGRNKVVLGKTTKGALGKAPLKKRPGLNKKNLAKLGTMTLKEKIETAAQECSDEEGQGKPADKG